MKLKKVLKTVIFNFFKMGRLYDMRKNLKQLKKNTYLESCGTSYGNTT